jgi:hypothetical protein
MLRPGIRTAIATRYVLPLREGGSLPAIVDEARLKALWPSIDLELVRESTGDLLERLARQLLDV